MIGNAMGHYKIASLIGKGGMGEVYRAKDTKLNRDVALKVLPAEFANDPKRMARFKREAQLLASLNHPNIAAIYGLEESGSIGALVMELAEGPTLGDRISKGPIPLDEALSISKQIAEALEAAHEKGIIHRDLKPANIKVIPEGAVKVLDFGLAKASEGEAAPADASQSPTLSLAATKAGVILGTAAYMSPEQARGAAVDKRCDIWSFGVVLFEMLTGKQLFSGETVSDTLAAVLRADVDWSLLPANTPTTIRTLLRRCLAKDRKQRLQAIGEARIVIEEYLANPSSASVQETASAGIRRKSFERLAWVSAVVLFIAASTVLYIVNSHRISELSKPTRLEYMLGEDEQFTIPETMFLAVSPDGRQFAYQTNKGLFLRSLDKYETTLIADAEENPSNPFFSHDNKWVGYNSAAENKLKKVSVTGGKPISLCNIGGFLGAYWGTDEKIIIGEMGRGIIQISADTSGGTPKLLFPEEGAWYFHPQLLPDKKTLLYTLGSSPLNLSIWTRSLGSPESKRPIFPGERALYLPKTGRIIYGFENSLYAFVFEPSKPAPIGASAPVFEGVYRSSSSSGLQFDVSETGTLVYAPSSAVNASPKRALVWVDRNGNEEPLSVDSREYNQWAAPQISPDGNQVALTVNINDIWNVWILDLNRNNNIWQLTKEGREGAFPVWIGNDRIAYSSTPDRNHWDIGIRPVDGSGKVEKLSSGGRPFSVSKDKKILLIWELSPPLQADIVALSLDGSFPKRPLLHEKCDEQNPQISPNGKWLAYVSNKTSRNEVYVCPFPEMKPEWKVSEGGGYGPLWSPKDGREIFYRNGESVMAVAVETEPIFKRLQMPKELFKKRFFYGSYYNTIYPLWDISPKDNRFLMVKEITAGGPRKINVILNWTEELKKQVPAK
jgi:eukaryotic-like serine/threonine-protein kinase